MAEGPEGKGIEKLNWHQDRVQNLMISEYLTSGKTLEGAGLQDTLCLPRLSNGLSLKNYSHSLVGVLNPRGPGIIPDRFFGRVGIGRHRSLALLSISNLILPNSDPFFEYALR